MVSVGDTYNGLSQIANGSYLSIQPTGTQEAVIHNIYCEDGSVEHYFTDGSNTIKFDSDTTNGTREGMFFHVTNTKYIKVKNVSGGALYFGFDGIYTHA